MKLNLFLTILLAHLVFLTIQAQEFNISPGNISSSNKHVSWFVEIQEIDLRLESAGRNIETGGTLLLVSGGMVASALALSFGVPYFSNFGLLFASAGLAVVSVPVGVIGLNQIRLGGRKLRNTGYSKNNQQRSNKLN